MMFHLLAGRVSRPGIILVLLVFLPFPSFPAAVFAQDSRSSDTLILENIRTEIASDSRLPIRGISISVLRGAVRLRGVVQTLAQKKWIEEIAYSVDGVRVVDNQIWIDAPNVSDDDLRQALIASMNRDALHGFAGVDLRVQRRMVTLRGEVRSWGERHTLEEIVAVTPGVRELKNELKIRDKINNSDELIRLAVADTLRRRIQMSSGFMLKVTSDRGIVTLKGRVRSDVEKRRALQAVLFVPGVVDVIDKIEVLPE